MSKCEQKCSICGNITPFVIPDIFSIKTAHSETPIDEIIKRLINLKEEISTELLDEKHTFACQNCLIKIDEYDLYYINIEKIQNELINIISRSTQAKDKIEISGVSFKQEAESYDIFTDYIEHDEDDIEELKKEITFVAKCEICDVEFNSEEELNQHEHIYQLSLELSNSDFSSTIIEQKTRQKNVNLTDDIVKIRNKVNKCSECGENFYSKGEYKEHIREHKKNKYKCQICEKSFVNDVLLDIHQAVHEGRSELECPYCLKVLSSRGAMVKHRRIHLQEYKYQCERCGKQFLHDTSFRMHMYAHDDTRKVSCKICHRQFRCTPHLNRHMRIHTGEKPYSCPTCGKLFAQRYNMMIHYKSHDPNNGEFKCTVCKKSFTIRKRLNEHLKTEHNTILETPEHKFERPKRIAVFDYSDLTEAIKEKK